MNKEVMIDTIGNLDIKRQQKKRLVETTEKSFDPQSRRLFDCYRAVAYVSGDLDTLEVEEGTGKYPGYRALIDSLLKSGRARVSQPRNILDIAVVKTGLDAYHIGLVVQTNPVKIWAKEGLTEAKITELEKFSGYRDSQGKVDFFTQQQKT